MTGRNPPVGSTLSRRVRGVLSPYRERGIQALARPSTGGIPAYAGMTGRVAPPDRSTLSRRIRGVLSPYRERGDWALAHPSTGGIPAYAGMTVMGA